jgi:hypothetical protein
VAVGVPDLVDAEGVRVVEGARVAEGARAAEGARDGEGAGVSSVRDDGPLSGLVVTWAGVGPSELKSAPLTSGPAWSMASHAVTDTPATAASQIVAMPTAKRIFSTM